MLSHFFLAIFLHSVCILSLSLLLSRCLLVREIDGNLWTIQSRQNGSENSKWAKRKQASKRMNERVRAGTIEAKKKKYWTRNEKKKDKKKNNNKVSSPFGCNRCFCTAIYLLSCMYRVISSFTSCISDRTIIPTFITQSVDILFSIGFCVVVGADVGVGVAIAIFLPLLSITVVVLSLNFFNILYRTSKFHYKRVIWLTECRKTICIASIQTHACIYKYIHTQSQWWQKTIQ